MFQLVSGTRHRLAVPAVVVIMAFVVALSGSAMGASKHLSMPSTGVITVTEFGDSTPMGGSTMPRTVVLNTSQSAILRSRVSKIEVMSLSAASLMCMENEEVFMIAVHGSLGLSKPVWFARAELCPAPGIIYVQGKVAGKPEISKYCTLKGLLLSYFPKGSVNGTRRMLGFC